MSIHCLSCAKQVERHHSVWIPFKLKDRQGNSILPGVETRLCLDCIRELNASTAVIMRTFLGARLTLIKTERKEHDNKVVA